MSSALQVMNMDQTAAECAARIRSCRSSGLSVRQWCSDHNISPQTYYRWQRRIFDMVKAQETLMEQLSFLFNEAEVFAAAAEEKETTEVAGHKRRKKNNDYTMNSIPENLPVERIEHRLEGKELV